MRGNPQYRTQVLRRESRPNDRQESRLKARWERQEGKAGGKGRRGSGAKDRRESWAKGRREGRTKDRRESAIERVRDGWRWGQRALRHEGLGGKARHTGTDALYAVPPRFPSENQMNRSENAAPQPAYTIAGSSRQRLRA